MKFKIAWDFIFVPPFLFYIGGLFGFFKGNIYAGSFFFLTGISLSVCSYLGQRSFYKKLYTLLNKEPIKLTFQNELRPDKTDPSKVWAYYKFDDLNVGLKLDVDSNYNEQDLNPHTLVQDVNNHKIYFR